jgi:hypothetical protein
MKSIMLSCYYCRYEQVVGDQAYKTLPYLYPGAEMGEIGRLPVCSPPPPYKKLKINMYR